MTPWGLYVHIPFCPYKCDYCDFVAVGGGAAVARWHEPYVAALLAEAAHWLSVLRPAEPPVSVFYGGGTPTVLGAGPLAALHRGLADRFGLPRDAEVTVECNPGTVTAADLVRLRDAGIGRLSIGLQAAQDRLLAALGRRHTAAAFQEAWDGARRAGFGQISADIMYALPGQDLTDVAATMALLGRLRPEHVSAYGLQVEEGTPFFARARQGRLALPTEDQAAQQFACVRASLTSAGYEHYEISNFALPGQRCRHNLLYWCNADWLGLGVGAHSHWHGRRWANTSRLAVYRDGLAAGRGWVQSEEAPDEVRARSEGAFLGLRLLDGLDLAAYARRYGLPLDQAFPGAVERLVAEGLCEVAAGCLRLRPEAVAIANRAFVAFV